MTLVDDVIDAHGGLVRWRKTAAIALQLSSGGLAFATKGQRRALHDFRATVATTGQVVDLEAPDWSHRSECNIPKPRGLRWSTTDIAAFAACALWTYVSLPFVLPELDVEEDNQTRVRKVFMSPRPRPKQIRSAMVWLPSSA